MVSVVLHPGKLFMHMIIASAMRPLFLLCLSEVNSSFVNTLLVTASSQKIINLRTPSQKNQKSCLQLKREVSTE